MKFFLIMLALIGGRVLFGVLFQDWLNSENEGDEPPEYGR